MVATAGKKGVWEPLPLIVYGYAIHPLSQRDTRRDTRSSNRTRVSIYTDVSGTTEDHLVHRDVVSLEVGDEIYAFEKYTPKGKEVEGIWYRGYVVCAPRRPLINWSTDPSSSKSPLKSDESQVFIGIFPESHIYVRDELADAEGRLAEVASHLNGSGAGSYTGGGAEAAKNEDDPDTLSIARKSFKVGPRPDQANSSRSALPVYPASLRSSSPAESQVAKPLPPRPSLKSGDETASGAVQPIIDEIASALREWHALMFQYLARRDYNLFHLVREHIEALHLGRRQLLVQTLSSEETVNLRRECVVRLVGGNVVQGLDIIVRHPTWGALVTTDVEGEVDPRSWVSPVRMYAMQTALAYMDPMSSPGVSKASLTPAVDLSSSFGPIPTPAHSAFPDFLRTRGIPRGCGSFSLPAPAPSGKARFYHVFLDVRAFVASPCSPGETAELFFSLYNKTEHRFLTEDFSAYLNHNGVLARDPTARIRSLFTDLVQSDVQEPIYLVCRIVRNGAFKIGSGMSSSGAIDGRRGSDVSFRERDSATSNGWDPSASSLALNTPLSGLSNRNQVVDNTANFRRPFGCAILELTQLSQLAHDQNDISATREHTMPIYVPTNETTFSMLHQDIILNNYKEFEKSPRAEMIAISIKIFRGDAETIIRENTSLLQDSSLTRRLSFPDVVFPGDIRNDMYIKLWSGEFTSSSVGQARRSVANFARGQVGTSHSNIQVTMEVRDQAGKSTEPILSSGSGEPLTSQFNSLVFLRNALPTYGELVKLTLPLVGITKLHVFFTFRHRTSREKVSRSPNDSPDRPFAFAFLPLFPDGRAALEDGSHTLILYRADRLNQIAPDVYLNATYRLTSGQKLDQIFVPPDMQRHAQIMKDTMTIRSSLCSTKYTQNPVLLNLLYWEHITDTNMLSTVLSKFTFVGEVEIVKFLSDIFDALFGILVSSNNQSGEMDLLVFNALVTVLGIVQDRRFNNFQPVLDVYIEKHFNCPSAASHIIHSMNRLLANPNATETALPLRAALKVWDYIFKFIARSRELQKVKEMGIAGGATAEHLESTFRRELRAHLSEVNRMMSTTTPPSIVGTQTFAIQHFTSILPELDKIFPIAELVSHVRTFANAIVTGKGKIVTWKLIMFLQVVRGFLFDKPQSRTLLLEAVVIWIRPHFGRFDEYVHTQPGDPDNVKDAARINWMENIRLCVTIVAVMLDKLCNSLAQPSVQADRTLLRKEQDHVDYLLSLLPRLVDSYQELQHPASQRALEQNSLTSPPSAVPVTFPESYPFSLLAHRPQSPSNPAVSGDVSSLFNPGLGETAVVFLVLVSMSSKKQLLDFLESSFEIEGRENFSNLLTHFFKVASSILDNDAFPSSWLNINIFAHKVLVKFMDPVATLLEREFIPGPQGGYEFDTSLWTEGFYMLLKLLSSDQLVIEEFSPQKRRAVWRLAHDVRGEGAAILFRLWDSLGWPEDVSVDNGAIARYGGYQVLLSSLVGQVVNLCLSHHDQLRNNAVQILYSMIVSEYHVSRHFDHIENELVSKLDQLFMSDSKGDNISRAFFIGHLRHLFESSNVDEVLRDRVMNFLDSVDLFLELLLSVRALPEGEEFADDRVIATLRLMNFIRRIGRDEIYIKYVHQLVNMHLQSQNYVEAALMLKLHSDLHEWDLHSFVPPMEDLGLPQQSQFHRKETLCLLILDYLGKGRAWESAIVICKELAYQHAEVTFNYARLAEILRHQADLLDHIIMDQRYYSDYFRVAFYGDFPVALRHKQFIYRGFEWEKFGAFCERMLNKHPHAQLLKIPSDPPPDIRFGTNQYIQCTAVAPEPDRSMPVFSDVDVPLSVRTYYEHSAINLFSCSRPVVKVSADGAEETWLEKTYFTTEESFPTVLRRSEIVAVEAVEISPVEHAFQEVEQRTKELSTLYSKYSLLAKTGQVGSVNALTMALNGAVDPSLDSGVPSLRHFLANEYIVRNADKAESINRLRIAIDDQVRMIDNCLKLHGQICTPEMLVIHEGTLEKFFRKNFSEEIRRLQMNGSVHEPSPSIRSDPAVSQYQNSLYEHSIDQSTSTISTSRPKQLVNAPALQVSKSRITLPPASPTSPHHDLVNGSGKPPTQTPLQRGLAHLARHGLNGVSSRPETGGSDSISGESPPVSLVNVVGSAPTTGSIKSRLSSRFGGFNFGRS